MNIKEIKRMLDATPPADLPDVLAVLARDKRAGVKKLAETYKKCYNKQIEEEKRLFNMLNFERKYAQHGLICGVDEAGAGAFAGPVVAAAVIMPAGLTIPEMNDSKKLSKAKRKELQNKILEAALAFKIVYICNEKIDEINILQARLQAMVEAVAGLEPAANFALVDGDKVLNLGITNVAIEGGDAKSHSIACASILAKVARDELMLKYHEKWPQYGFDSNKGYGTAKHREALAKFGPCPIHRRSFTL